MGRRFGRMISTLGLVLILAGCGLPLSVARPTPTPHPARSADPVAMAAKEALHPDPYFDFGLTVQITPQGFHPAVLIAECCKTITWKNLLDTAVTVTFDHQRVSSGQIPPGGTWTFTPPNMQALTYHADGRPDFHGAIQVNQTFESMARTPFTDS